MQPIKVSFFFDQSQIQWPGISCFRTPICCLIFQNEFWRSFVFRPFLLVDFAFGIECFSDSVLWSKNKMKTDQMCGGVTRDEWNVVAMTRGWNVKESRAVRLKVGLWRRKRPKWRRSAPSILKWIFRFHFKTTKPNKQSVVEPVGLRLLHVTDLFLYFSPISELIQLKIQQQFHFPMDFFLSFKSGRSLLKYNAQLISICLINMFASILRSGNDNDRFKVYLHTWIVLRQTMGILISLWTIDVSFKFFF